MPAKKKLPASSAEESGTVRNIEPSEVEKVIEVEISRLDEFADHPFQVEMDKQMETLKDSIEKYGVLSPVIIRPEKNGRYEIISGHRRKFISASLGYTKIPAIIRHMDDDEATIYMVDSNLHREFILPSERAHAYKMKNDALVSFSRRKKKFQEEEQRQDEECGQKVHKPKGKRSVEVIGEQEGKSAKQIQRYIRLTYLIPELMKKVDEKALALNPAVEISYLTEEEQNIFFRAMEYSQSSPSLSQSQRIRKLCGTDDFSYETLCTILSEVKKGESKRVIFKNEQLYKFFPRSYTAQQMQREILEILKTYRDEYYS